MSAFEGHTGVVWCVTFSPDGATLASVSNDQKIRLWNVKTGKETRAINVFHPDLTVVFSPDGKTLAAGGWDRYIRIWDLATGEETQKFKGRQGVAGAISSLAFSPDGERLASGSWNAPLTVWRLKK
ncbi:MAG: hypothetical protein HY716_00790 [Planctomycetes bacterium]|nr:hypothetical protein [Planctomycetota bacterium]